MFEEVKWKNNRKLKKIHSLVYINYRNERQYNLHMQLGNLLNGRRGFFNSIF